MSLNKNKAVSIALIDDDAGACEIVKDVLLSRGDKYNFHFKNTIPEFRELIESVKPDIALIDIYLPLEGQGLEVLQWLKEFHKEIKAIVFTGKSGEVLEAILSNADGFISKSEVDRLPQVIQEVINEGVYLSPKNSRILIQQTKEYEQLFRQLLNADITPKDKENISALVEERSNIKAAGKLGKSLNTFKSQNTRILKKFKMKRMKYILENFGRFFK